MKKSKSVFLTSEDYWSIWLGSFFLLFGIVVYIIAGNHYISDGMKSQQELLENETRKAPFKTAAYYRVLEKGNKLNSANSHLGKTISWLLESPKSWSDNPLKALVYAGKQPTTAQLSAIETKKNLVTNLAGEAVQKEEVAQNAAFANEQLNKEAANAAGEWHIAQQELQKLEKKYLANSYNLLTGLILLALVLAAIFGVGAYFMGASFIKFSLGFLGIFILATLSYLLAAQADMKNMGISYAIWAIVLGLIISNTLGTPGWIKPALKTEFYIKTGLVLLGSEILINKIMAIGLPGIFVSWVVTPIVLVVTYWFGQKILKIGSKTLNITISADMSVCGVSAAIATAAACNAKKEELTMAIGLSMVFTSIMMVALPAFINAVGMPEVLGGAWIGGTIDATGAVVAAGAFLGDKALNVAATIKMIQNILIGFIAFGVAVYWATKVENNGKVKVGASEIWKRFPKFILGFLGASLLFSALYASMSQGLSFALIDNGLIDGFTKDLRGWLFCLAFVSIGLSVNFKELKHQFSGGKPLLLYVCGQLLNLVLTLLMAYLMFYIVFPEITELI